MNSLPLTQSGKVDRTKLKSLWSKRGAAEREASGSSTSLELVTEVQREVFEAFKETLGLETLGIHDNFFELGGHSLSAMQLQTALASRGISLTLPEIFRAQTVEKIAKLCDIVSNCTIEAGMHVMIKHQTFFFTGCRLSLYPQAFHSFGAVDLCCLDRGARCLASFAQERLWLEEQLRPGWKSNGPHKWPTFCEASNHPTKG